MSDGPQSISAVDLLPLLKLTTFAALVSRDWKEALLLIMDRDVKMFNEAYRCHVRLALAVKNY